MEGADGREPNGIEQIFEGINKDLASLATSGNLADSEGDNGDIEQDDEVTWAQMLQLDIELFS